MATPKLKVRDELVGLRQLNAHIFEAKNMNILKSVVGESRFVKNRFLLCLTVQDIEDEVDDLLFEISGQMVGSNWMAFICDVGSHDNTYKRICDSKDKPINAVVLQFERIPIDQASAAISKIADIYAEDFPCRIVHRKIKKLDTARRKIKSFCTVSTKETIHETDLMIKSLRQFHDQPIYIMCDLATEEFLKPKGYKDLFFKKDARLKQLNKIKKELEQVVKKRNTFHRPEAILKKMHSMKWAMENNSNTFFLDSDIVVVGNLQDDFAHDIVLSPHYDSVGRARNGLSYGFFNAGYIFCADKTFPDYWEFLYLNRSKFYEQEGMNYIPEKYNIGIFERGHNVGFWRRLDGNSLSKIKNIKSFHAHFDPNLDFRNNAPLKNMNCVMVALAKDYIKKNNKNLYSYLGSGKLKMSKLAFIHYGKAAGVYVNLYMKHLCVPEYNFQVSWFDGLKRDWGEDELLDILKKPEERIYVHNHHINWSLKTVFTAKENGWFTFTFLRNPRELLCSLYYWIQKVRKEKGVSPVGVKTFGGVSPEYAESIKQRKLDLGNAEFDSLDVFIRKMIEVKNLRRLWTIPSYVQELDYVAEFTENNFSNFTSVFFSHEHISQPPKNVSGNKGYDHYREKKMISDETDILLRSDESYLEYDKYMNL